MLRLGFALSKQIVQDYFFTLFIKILNRNFIITISVFLIIFELMAVLKVTSLNVIRHQLILYYLMDFQNVLFDIHIKGILSEN